MTVENWDNPVFHEGRIWGRKEEQTRIIAILKSHHIDDGCPEFRPCYACQCVEYIEEMK